ncbi:hypothetical protein B0T17DRAFT_511843 [Bombardia bombarda]|uniref:Uncharacterized protein n=1 Tax=Bombardia bombarda TaxID=252184 RepID=A0AA39WD21_9PEZI|nr:hypothetical protein B0T17DRAFT_511843 [Bombardia bombarda]
MCYVLSLLDCGVHINHRRPAFWTSCEIEYYPQYLELPYHIETRIALQDGLYGCSDKTCSEVRKGRKSVTKDCQAAASAADAAKAWVVVAAEYQWAAADAAAAAAEAEVRINRQNRAKQVMDCYQELFDTDQISAFITRLRTTPGRPEDWQAITEAEGRVAEFKRLSELVESRPAQLRLEMKKLARGEMDLDEFQTIRSSRKDDMISRCSGIMDDFANTGSRTLALAES